MDRLFSVQSIIIGRRYNIMCSISIVKYQILLGCSAATRKHTMVGQKYFKGEGQTYTKYNKINNNSENFRRGGRLLPAAPLSCGPAWLNEKSKRWCSVVCRAGFWKNFRAEFGSQMRSFVINFHLFSISNS